MFLQKIDPWRYTVSLINCSGFLAKVFKFFAFYVYWILVFIKGKDYCNCLTITRVMYAFWGTVSDTGILVKRNPSATIRSRTHDLSTTSLDALPMSYSRLVGAKQKAVKRCS